MGPRSVPEGTRKGRKAGSCQIGFTILTQSQYPGNSEGTQKTKKSTWRKGVQFVKPSRVASMGYPRARRAIKRQKYAPLPSPSRKRRSFSHDPVKASFPFLSFHSSLRSGHDRLGFFPGVYGQSAGVRVGTFSSSRRGTRSRRGRRSCGDER